MKTKNTDLLDERTLSIIKASNEVDSTLLITGSTGTGKSHLAHLVHRMSLRRQNKRWCKINLATLSENLVESELFGHERGAFTGADTRRVGKLEICNGGTVFLDEIGELPLRIQTKLLDFIQYKRITPVGSNREIELDVKIIVATNKNLEIAVKEGLFRADLYHRLNVFHVHLKDLCFNGKFLASLVDHFLLLNAERMQRPVKKLSRQAQHVFKMYRWPGNIRELENTIEYAFAMSQTGEITTHDFPAHMKPFVDECLKTENSHRGFDEEEQLPTHAPTALPTKEKLDTSTPDNPIALVEVPISLDFRKTREAFEKAYLNHIVRLCGGQINLTSRRIGLNKVSLAEKMKRYGIDWRKFKADRQSMAPVL